MWVAAVVYVAHLLADGNGPLHSLPDHWVCSHDNVRVMKGQEGLSHSANQIFDHLAGSLGCLNGAAESPVCGLQRSWAFLWTGKHMPRMPLRVPSGCPLEHKSMHLRLRKRMHRWHSTSRFGLFLNLSCTSSIFSLFILPCIHLLVRSKGVKVRVLKQMKTAGAPVIPSWLSDLF